MNQTVILAIIVVLSQVLAAYIVNRARRKEKALDWLREDEIESKKAKKAEEAANLLLAANERVAATAELTNGKLDQIHTLVNSNLTASIQSELEATILSLSLMRENVELNKAAGRKPSQTTLNGITMKDTKVKELKATLNDRLQQTKLADDQLKKR